MIERNGWLFVRQAVSHKIYKHPSKEGVVVIPEHGGDIPKETLNSILKQAGLKLGRENENKHHY